MGSSQLHSVMSTVSRDPSKHESLQDRIEHQSTALYSTARLWDDGIIKPVDTRDTVGLALGLAYKVWRVDDEQRARQGAILRGGTGTGGASVSSGCDRCDLLSICAIGDLTILKTSDEPRK